MEIKHIEAEDMKREMDEVQQRKYAEYDDLRSNVINTYTALSPCSSDIFNPIIDGQGLRKIPREFKAKNILYYRLVLN